MSRCAHRLTSTTSPFRHTQVRAGDAHELSGELALVQV